MGTIRLFSKRHEKAIFAKTLRFSVASRLRRRIWALMLRLDHSYYYQPNPIDNWHTQTSVLEQLPGELCFRYGIDSLQAFSDAEEGLRVLTDLKGFVERGYPSQVFDVLELFWSELPQEQQAAFQNEVNTVLEDEGSEWRMVDGQMFKVDSQFLEVHLVTRSFELLKAEGFEGALDELKEARNALTDSDVKGAIHGACKSMESVLKAVIGIESGNASTLIRQLEGLGFYEGLPPDVARAFGETVLMVLPFMRNRLGGHGQGATVVDVPRAYGELAVYLAAAFSSFIVNRSIEINPKERRVSEERAKESEDDIPFSSG